jgi:P27 family predicted phage terminase small subunit
MTRGRPPKPTRLKLLEGNPGKRRINRAEPIPAQAEVRMPRGLTPAAQRVWKKLAPDLIDKKILTAWDVPAFAMLCEAAATYEAARDLVALGVLIRGRHGDELVVNKAWRVYRDAAQLFRAFAGDFGLTPSSRTRLSNAEPATDAEIERMLIPIGRDEGGRA